MNLTFKMTGEEYFIGLKYKKKKGSMNQHLAAKAILFAILIIIASIIFKFNYMFYVFAAFFIAMGFIMEGSEKKLIIRNYTISPIQSGEHTLRLYDEGMELINSYEKIFVPWQSVFAVKETPSNIQILPTYRKGIAVISKERYGGSQLEGIMSTIRQHVKVEEGKR